MRMGLLLAGACFLALAPASPLLAQDAPVTDCDRLAAEPGTVSGIPGVALDQIDPAAALPACEQAVREHPGVARLILAYARALERSGDPAAAAQLYTWAAADGLPTAQAALERLEADGADPQLGLSAPTDPATLALADSLDGIAEVLEAVERDGPRERFDPLAALQPTGVAVDAITGWVGREVALVPYRGTLRGARGTLMDRYGNSLDRALLLAQLLADAGYPVRLARATLDPGTAQALAAVEPPPADAAQSADDAALAASLAAAAAGDYADAFAAGLAEADAVIDRQQAAIEDRSARLAGQLLADLGGPAPQGGDEARLAALADHWWVQVQDGDAWIDADPSAAIVGTLVPEATLAPADLPPDLRHSVTLRVVVEFWEEGRLREETLLSHAMAPADVIDRTILLRHVPVSVTSALQLMADAGDDPVPAVLEAASDAWVWQPELAIGDETVVDRLFTTGGDVLSAGDDSLRSLGIDAGLFAGMQQLGSILDDEPAPQPAGPPDEANAAVRVSAEWLEIEIAVPGEAPVTQRRAVFDLIGPAARTLPEAAPPTLGPQERLQRALGLMREVDILIAGAAPAASYLGQVLARDGARLLRTVAVLLRSPDGWEEAALQPVPRIPLPLYRQAQLRFGTAPDRPWLDRPNVALAWSGWSGTGPADLVPTLLYDIVANDVGVAAEDGFAARLAQGVRDTVVEDELAGPDGGHGTADLYEADSAAGRSWVRLDPAEPAAVDSLGLPADARASIAADLATGMVVLVPPAAVDGPAGMQMAWWRVDPRTGTTLGMTLAGGAAITEESFIFAQLGAQVSGCFIFLAHGISKGLGGLAAGSAVCFAGGVTGAVAGGVGGAALGAATALAGGVIAALTTP